MWGKMSLLQLAIGYKVESIQKIDMWKTKSWFEVALSHPLRGSIIYGRAEEEIKQLVTSLSLPFLPTPMGKGV